MEKLGGAVVVTHSQSGIMGHHMARILKERGHLDLLKGLGYDRRLLLTAQQRTQAGRFRQYSVYRAEGRLYGHQQGLPGHGGCDQRAPRRRPRNRKAEYIKLDELGKPVFNGTTHMMMLGTNNLEVADVIPNWVDQNVNGQKRKK